MSDQAGAHRLPPIPAPAGDYIPAVLAGDIAISAGMAPKQDGALIVTGRVGDDVDLDAARAAAGVAALNALAAVASVVGGPERITGVAYLRVFVRCTADFTAISAVADGASAALIGVLGDAGRGPRTALGVYSLPQGAPVEVELAVTYGGA